MIYLFLFGTGISFIYLKHATVFILNQAVSLSVSILAVDLIQSNSHHRLVRETKQQLRSCEVH